MGANEDIGKGYKKRLDGYQVSPSDNLWDRIEADLDKKKKRRIPFWLFFGGFGVLLLSFGTWYVINSMNESSIEENSIQLIELNTIENSLEKVVNSEAIDESIDDFDKKENLSEESKNNEVSNETQYTNSSSNRSYSNNQNQNSTTANKKLKSKKSSSKSSTTLSNKALSTIEPYGIVFFDWELTPFSFEFPEIEEVKMRKKKQNDKLIWDVKLYGGPSYFTNLSKGSALDFSLSDNQIKGNIEWYVGVMANFQINERSTLGLGIERFQGSYTTLDADVTNENGFLVATPGFTGVSINPNALVNSNLGNSSTIDLKQQFTYLEFPLQYTYQLFQGKLNWDIYGGLGFVVLSDDSIIAESSNGNSVEIGRGSNLNKTSLNAHFGAGVSYSLSKKFILSLEPRFKYYLKPLNDNAKFNPFAIGIGLGVRYKF
ncbi:MAG: hypothetical protein ACWA5P_05005 [bacterium]